MAKKGRGRSGSAPASSAKQDDSRAAPDIESADALKSLHIWQIQAVRDVLFVAAVIAVIWLGYALRTVTVPLLVALLMAYLFEPLIVRLSRHPSISRATAVGGLLTTIIALFLLVLAIVIPLAVGQSIDLARDLREGKIGEQVASLHRYVPSFLDEEFNSFLEIVPGAADAVRARQAEEDQRNTPDPTETQGDEDRDSGGAGDAGAGGGAGDAGGAGGAGGTSPPPETVAPPLTSEDVRAIVQQELAQQRAAADSAARGERLSSLARGGWSAIRSAIGIIFQIGLLLFLIPFYFFFFSLWYPAVVRFGRSLLPEKNKKRNIELLQKMDRVVSGFVRGRITISFIMGIMFAIGWMICGVPYALLLGMAVGVLSLVPYLSGAGIPIAIGLLLIEHFSGDRNVWLGWFGALLWPTLVYVIVQFCENYILIPTIAGKATNLDPVTIVVAVLAGGSVLGVYGMLLSIPVAACGKILFVEIVLPRIREWTEGKARDPLPIDRE